MVTMSSLYTFRLHKLHGAPGVWWVGQILKYLIQPQPKLQDKINKMASRYDFTHPIVGVHIRRTDKLTDKEAQSHSIHEYMEHVEDWFKLYSKINPNSGHTKRVYLATDDPTVVKEAREAYKDYTFINNIEASESAKTSTRYEDSSLMGIILDVHFLSQTDYLVCTFSSQVCRLAYEIMQSLHVDASSYFYSLDDVYYYGGGQQNKQIAIAVHKARNKHEMDLQIGDVINVAGDNKDGTFIGTNIRTMHYASYPSYKVKDHIDIAKAP